MIIHSLIRRLAALACAALILVAGVAPVTRAREPVDVPAVFVADPCRYHSSIDGTITSEATLFDLPMGLDGSEDWEELGWVGSDDGTAYRGIAWATVPDLTQSHVFLTRGQFLEVYDLEMTGDLNPLTNDPVAVVDIAAATGISGLELGRIAAGSMRPYEVAPGVVVASYALYLVGTSSAGGHWIVLDQEWAIDGVSPTGVDVYGSGLLCAGTECDVTDVLDVAVGDLADTSFSEEAYITAVQDFSGFPIGMTYRLERSLLGNSFTLSPQYGSVWGSPLVPGSNGLVFVPGSHDAWVVNKQDDTLHKAGTASDASCAFSGEPTDVAIWEPGTSVEPRYMLVTTDDGSGGSVEVVPVGVCAAAGAPVFDFPAPSGPTSIALHPIDARTVLAVVTAEGKTLGDGTVAAYRLRVTIDGGADTFELLENADGESSWTHDMSLGGYFSESCPSEAAVGVRFGRPYEAPRGVDRQCLPNDPRCPPPAP